MNSRGRTARMIARHHLSGMLSTQSKRYPGYPYGSALPHVIDAQGCPIILISDLAEHTQNARSDPRVSYIVAQAGSQLQSFGRVSILGMAQTVTHAEVEAKYRRFHPEASQSLSLGGFHFFRIRPEHVRVIEGFGGIHWIAGDSYLAPSTSLAQAEDDLLHRLNVDHLKTMRILCSHKHHMELEHILMIGIDVDGFDLRADGRVLRFDFPEPVTTPAQAQQAMDAMAQKACG